MRCGCFSPRTGIRPPYVSQQRREIKIKRYAHVIEGHVLYVKKNGGNATFREKEICDASAAATRKLIITTKGKE